MIDSHLPPDLRMAAVIVLFDTIPDLATVINMAHFIRSERNMQLVHFVVTVMESLSENRMPDRREL